MLWYTLRLRHRLPRRSPPATAERDEDEEADDNEDYINEMANESFR